MPIRISGLNSGLDTESIISALVSSYSVKKNNYVKAQTKLTWKQDAWKSINTKIYSLYSSISSLRYSSAYSLKSTTVSDTTKATVTAGSSAVNGTQSLKISQLAKAGYITGGKLSSGITSDSTLADLGYAEDSGTITVNSGGKKTDITVGKDTKISDFVQSLKDAGLNASYDSTNLRMFVSASDTGVDNDFSLIGSDANGLTALGALGLSVNSAANTEAYATTASYARTSDGSSYYQLDSDGNVMYDTDGKALVNTEGKAYDAAATNTYITSVLNKLSSAYSTKAATETDNADLNTKLTYANAYQSVTELSGGTYASQINKIKELNEVSNPSTSYIVDGVTYTSREETKDAEGNTQYVYSYRDADNQLQIMESSTKYDSVQEEMDSLAKEAGLITVTPATEEGGKETTDRTGLTNFISNLSTLKTYEDNSDYADLTSEIQGYSSAELAENIASMNEQVDTNNTTIAEQNAIISENSYWDAGDYTGVDISNLAASITSQITTAVGVTDGTTTIATNSTATRVNGQDAKITLNGADFESSSNTFTINGLTIKATGVTADGEEVSITTATDTQGLYDKIKDFLTQYNEVVNEISSLYNADSASGYEPLTSDEKDAMTDTEIEQWETKIKDSLLRRDSTLGSVLTSMTNSMAKGYTVNGTTYSLGSFGISTLGYLNAAENENYAYHIAGDADDTASASSTDKLMAALESDPDSVVEFMKQLTGGLYDSLDKSMKSSTISSAYTVYNDKEMASEYSDYTDLISTWEDRLTDLEDSYYKKFAAMESALATLQSSSSSLSSLLG